MERREIYCKFSSRRRNTKMLQVTRLQRVANYIEMHNFSDASSEGYETASYLRVVDKEGKVHCSLMIGKSRVAPLKTVTIPRLELTAATVAAKKRFNTFVANRLQVIHDASSPSQ